MSEAKHGFGNVLAELQPVSAGMKEKYQREIQAMYEKQLTGYRRGVWLVAAVMGVGFAMLFGTMAVIMPEGFPLLGRLGFAAGALFGLGWTVLGLRIFRRGSLNLKVVTLAAAGMGWGLPLTVAIILMISAPDTLAGLRTVVSALAYLVMGAVFLLQYVIERSEYKTREKLLEIELRLAELAERVAPQGRIPPAV